MPAGEPASLELLVHGVGGHPPNQMLDSARIVRVSGDDTAAIYRRVVDVHAEQRGGRDGADPVQEAYCWSGLTSGNASRALWLLLLPFMVANLAHWMRPGSGLRDAGRAGRLYGALVRLVALTLTVLFVASACEVAMDLTAWQCAGARLCAERHSWLAFLSPAQHGWWSEPGRRAALAAVVPAALVGLLWYLSNRTWEQYESQYPPVGGTRGGTRGGEGSALAEPGFWYGRRIVARLRAAHTAAGLVTVGLVLVGAATARDDGALGVLGRLLQGALALAGLVALFAVCRRGRDETEPDEQLDRSLNTWLPAGSLTLLALSVLYAGWSRPGWVSSGAVGGEPVFRGLALAQAALVIALGVTALVLHRRAPVAGTALGGLGGPAVAMLACGVGNVLTGGLAQRVADWLDGQATPGMNAGSPSPPVLLAWQAAILPVVLVVLLVPAAAVVIRMLRGARRLAPDVEASYGVGEGRAAADPARTRQIAARRAAARITESAPRLVGVLTGATLLFGAVALAGSWYWGDVPGRAAEGGGPFAEAVADTAQALGSWLIGIGFVAFVALSRLAYTSAATRQTIGMLWDVGTFWPRAAHPLAPPCYAERAVPDLTWRVATWTRETGGRLVVSAHSQGTVLAAATLWQLDPDTRAGVALLTYGAPLQRLYGRWFPAYFGGDELDRLRAGVHCWRNLWRDTDPIGGPVRTTVTADAPEVDRGPLTDPLAYGRSPQHPLPEGINGHGDYQLDPVFWEEREALLGRLASGLPGQRSTAPAAGEDRAVETGRTAPDAPSGA